MTGPEPERVEQLVLEVNVGDLDRSLATYIALGFELDRRDGGFAALRWGDRRLFLSHAAGLPPAAGPSRGNVRIIVPDVDRVWSVARRLCLAVEQQIGDRHYGCVISRCSTLTASACACQHHSGGRRRRV